MRSSRAVSALITILSIAMTASAANAEIAVSANDGKMVMENGVAKVRKEPLPDTVSIIDLSGATRALLRRYRRPRASSGRRRASPSRPTKLSRWSPAR